MWLFAMACYRVDFQTDLPDFRPSSIATGFDGF